MTHTHTPEDARLSQLEASIRNCHKRLAIGAALIAAHRDRFLDRTRQQLADAERRRATHLAAVAHRDERDRLRREEIAWHALDDESLIAVPGGHLY